MARSAAALLVVDAVPPVVVGVLLPEGLAFATEPEALVVSAELAPVAVGALAVVEGNCEA